MRAVAAVLVWFVCAGTLTAQSRERISIQGSGALVFPTAPDRDFANATRLGWEGQVRYTFARFSVGAGYQQATVYKPLTEGEFTGRVSVAFVEPRYVATVMGKVAVYLAGRAGAGKLECSPERDCPPQKYEPAFGGGGGLLFLLGGRVALDLGSQFFSAQYTLANGSKTRTGYVLGRLGLSLGLF